MRSIYIETSVISYLTAKSTRNIVTTAWQEETCEWWNTQKDRFFLYTSQLVIEEAGKGDRSAASRRLKILSGLPLLPVNVQAIQLSNSLIREGGVPKKAIDDALHISIAATNSIDFLLTWNCKHINNAET